MLLEYINDLINVVLYPLQVSFDQHPLSKVNNFSTLFFLIVSDINNEYILILSLLLIYLFWGDHILLDSLWHYNGSGLRIRGEICEILIKRL